MGIKEFLKTLRDGVAFTYSWLIICILAVSLINGRTTITAGFLLKLLILCIWGVLSFCLCFKTKMISRRGFIFSLTCFYILFIPAEIFMFYMMGIFQGNGSTALWTVFFTIIVLMYIISLIIDILIMKRKAVDYTEKLKAYKGGPEK